MKISNGKLKIFYIANARIPTEKAHGIQIMKMCEAFATKGADVTLVLPKRRNPIKQDPFSYYEVKPIFKIKKLPSLDLLFIDSPVTFILSALVFSISVFGFLFFRKKDYVVYTRGEIILFLSKFLSRRLFWETHIKPSNIDRYKKAVRKIGGVIVVTKYYRDILIKEFNVLPEKLLYFPDSVDLDIFDIDIDKGEARRRLNLPIDKKIIVYTGSLLKWKGIETLIESANFLDDDNLLYIVGDLKKDDSYYLPLVKSSPNIKFVGLKPYGKIPLWLKASDVLVLTGTEKNEISKYYTSPLKLFEYMASGKPIIAPRLPSFLDILNENNSFLVDSDDPRKLADRIKFVLANEAQVQGITEKAYNDSKNYSWNKRSESIKNFIENRLML
ncbi:MAG: glycosyltransferase family 4 protein [Parcubacteria group bacterium]|nr:glycosyltransferase family 4 protein [Parcubacteria group bacterium]MCR4342511.1 glycosyltransferase family 4 protein [Patescibacteria group bacterium]